MTARRILVSGRVQGVCYRDWTTREARSLGLAGWVRNLRSGEVEILAIGPDEAIAALVGICRTGPPAARVDRIQVHEAAAEAVDDFSIRPTA